MEVKLNKEEAFKLCYGLLERHFSFGKSIPDHVNSLKSGDLVANFCGVDYIFIN